ncbi:MAG: hypothetical protein R3Y21_04275, partial [Mycoplasmatota bacterium]
MTYIYQELLGKLIESGVVQLNDKKTFVVLEEHLNLLKEKVAAHLGYLEQSQLDLATGVNNLEASARRIGLDSTLANIDSMRSQLGEEIETSSEQIERLNIKINGFNNIKIPLGAVGILSSQEEKEKKNAKVLKKTEMLTKKIEDSTQQLDEINSQTLVENIKVSTLLKAKLLSFRNTRLQKQVEVYNNHSNNVPSFILGKLQPINAVDYINDKIADVQSEISDLETGIEDNIDRLSDITEIEKQFAEINKQKQLITAATDDYVELLNNKNQLQSFLEINGYTESAKFDDELNEAPLVQKTDEFVTPVIPFYNQTPSFQYDDAQIFAKLNQNMEQSAMVQPVPENPVVENETYPFDENGMVIDPMTMVQRVPETPVVENE